MMCQWRLINCPSHNSRGCQHSDLQVQQVQQVWRIFKLYLLMITTDLGPMQHLELFMKLFFFTIHSSIQRKKFSFFVPIPKNFFCFLHMRTRQKKQSSHNMRARNFRIERYSRIQEKFVFFSDMNDQAEWKIRKKQKNVYTIDQYINDKEMKKQANKQTSKQYK